MVTFFYPQGGHSGEVQLWSSFKLQAPWLFNPLSPNIHIQILQTDLHTSPLRIS